MSEYTDDDLGLLAEHVDHLQRRVNRLLHAYGGNHDQKTHGRGKSGAGKRKPNASDKSVRGGFLKGGLIGALRARKNNRTPVHKRKLASRSKFNKRKSTITGAVIGSSFGGPAAAIAGGLAGAGLGALHDKRRNRKSSARNTAIRLARKLRKKK